MESKKAAASDKELPLSRITKLMKERGLNPSLPCAVFDRGGALIGANRRMKSLLNQKIRLPLEATELEASWPFHNESDAGPAVLRKTLLHRDEKNPYVFFATAHLKTFKLQTFLLRAAKKEEKSSADPRSPERMLIVEIVRTGDLLGDKETRQVLFRTLSHEIRTSVLAMSGYLGIMETQVHDVKAVQESIDRMKVLVKRLESVVQRLDDFRVELGVLENQSPDVGRKKTS